MTQTPSVSNHTIQLSEVSTRVSDHFRPKSQKRPVVPAPFQPLLPNQPSRQFTSIRSSQAGVAASNDLLLPHQVSFANSVPSQSNQGPMNIINSVNNMVKSSLSSDRSILAMSAVRESRFLRVTQGISLFIRENYQIIRPILIALMVLLVVFVILPVIAL